MVHLSKIFHDGISEQEFGEMTDSLKFSHEVRELLRRHAGLPYNTDIVSHINEAKKWELIRDAYQKLRENMVSTIGRHWVAVRA